MLLKDISVVKLKIKKSYIEDATICGLIIATLAFHDQTKFMVFFQISAFLLELWKHRLKIPLMIIMRNYIFWEMTFVLLGISSLLWAPNNDTIISCAVSILQVTMCGMTLILYCDSRGKWHKAINFIIVAALILIVRLLVAVPMSAWGNGERVGQYLGTGNSGGYGNTGLTYVLSIGAIFVLHKGIDGKNNLYSILFVIITVFSFLSGSKKAMVLFAITVFMTSILNSKNLLNLLKSLIISAIVILLGWYLLTNNAILYNSIGIRFEYFINFFIGKDTDASTLTRVDYIYSSLEIFKEYPILGVGLDGFRYFNSRLCWAENNFLEILADLGIIGIIVYYSFPISIMLKSLKYRLLGIKGSSLLLVLLGCLFFVDMTMVTYSNDFLQMYWVLGFLSIYVK